MFFDWKRTFEVKEGYYVCEKYDWTFEHLTDWYAGLELCYLYIVEARSINYGTQNIEQTRHNIYFHVVWGKLALHYFLLFILEPRSEQDDRGHSDENDETL